MKLKSLLLDIRTLKNNIDKDTRLLEFYNTQINEMNEPDLGSIKEFWIVKFKALEGKIAKDKQTFKEMKYEATKGLESLTNKNYMLLLMNRYLAFKTFKEITKIMYISMSTAYRYHQKALKETEDIEVKNTLMKIDSR